MGTRPNTSEDQILGMYEVVDQSQSQKWDHQDKGHPNSSTPRDAA